MQVTGNKPESVIFLICVAPWLGQCLIFVIFLTYLDLRHLHKVMSTFVYVCIYVYIFVDFCICSYIYFVDNLSVAIDNGFRDSLWDVILTPVGVELCLSEPCPARR